MRNCPELRILFLTSFSDACFRAVRSISQMADGCHISLTIAHVTDPVKSNPGARRDLDSFFAEADHYDECHRVLIESDDPARAVAALCDEQNYDMIVAPSSDRIGIHKLFTSSLRARLLQRCRAPLWTAGKCLDHKVPKPRIQQIACLLDFDAPAHPHIRLAGALAARVGAKLRMAAVLPPVHEGRLADAIHSRAPLMPEVALDQIRRSFPAGACPEIDVAVGESNSELPRMLRRCDPDVVFVGPGQALAGIFRPRLSSWLDRLPCPAVCVDGGSASFDAWTFQRSTKDVFRGMQGAVEAA